MKAIDVHWHFGPYDRGDGGLSDQMMSGSFEVVRRFWAVLHPGIRESYKQVESLLAHQRCKGIKIHPTEHAYEIRDYGDKIFEFAASHKMDWA